MALWNDSAVAELDLRAGKIAGKLALLPPSVSIRPSSHPIALALSPDEKMLYVALANRDLIAGVKVSGERPCSWCGFMTRTARADLFRRDARLRCLSPDGAMLYAANSGSDSIAVFHTKPASQVGAPEIPIGFIPTEWYPTALAVKDNQLYIATGKGRGTGPNVAPQT